MTPANKRKRLPKICMMCYLEGCWLSSRSYGGFGEWWVVYCWDSWRVFRLLNINIASRRGKRYLVNILARHYKSDCIVSIWWTPFMFVRSSAKHGLINTEEWETFPVNPVLCSWGKQGIANPSEHWAFLLLISFHKHDPSKWHNAAFFRFFPSPQFLTATMREIVRRLRHKVTGLQWA
jgi:hypothetical protein